jgi:hypothetical protein
LICSPSGINPYLYLLARHRPLPQTSRIRKCPESTALPSIYNLVIWCLRLILLSFEIWWLKRDSVIEYTNQLSKMRTKSTVVVMNFDTIRSIQQIISYYIRCATIYRMLFIGFRTDFKIIQLIFMNQGLIISDEQNFFRT